MSFFHFSRGSRCVAAVQRRCLPAAREILSFGVVLVRLDIQLGGGIAAVVEETREFDDATRNRDWLKKCNVVQM